MFTSEKIIKDLGITVESDYNFSIESDVLKSIESDQPDLARILSSNEIDDVEIAEECAYLSGEVAMRAIALEFMTKYVLSSETEGEASDQTANASSTPTQQSQASATNGGDGKKQNIIVRMFKAVVEFFKKIGRAILTFLRKVWNWVCGRGFQDKAEKALEEVKHDPTLAKIVNATDPQTIATAINEGNNAEPYKAKEYAPEIAAKGKETGLLSNKEKGRLAMKMEKYTDNGQKQGAHVGGQKYFNPTLSVNLRKIFTFDRREEYKVALIKYCKQIHELNSSFTPDKILNIEMPEQISALLKNEDMFPTKMTLSDWVGQVLKGVSIFQAARTIKDPTYQKDILKDLATETQNFLKESERLAEHREGLQLITQKANEVFKALQQYGMAINRGISAMVKGFFEIDKNTILFIERIKPEMAKSVKAASKVRENEAKVAAKASAAEAKRREKMEREANARPDYGDVGLMGAPSFA